MHVSEEGHTWKWDIGSFKLVTMLYTYIRSTCEFWRNSDTPARSFRLNPDLWAPHRLPIDRLLKGVEQNIFLFVCVRLSIRNMENKLSGPTSRTIPSSGLRLGVSQYI